MKQSPNIRLTRFSIIALAIGSGLVSNRSQGAVTLEFSQVGADMIVSWDGDLTVTGLVSIGGTSGTIQINNTANQDAVVKTQPGDDAYQITVPTVKMFAGAPAGIVYSSQIGPAVTDRFGFTTFDTGSAAGFQVMVPDGFTTGSISGGFGVANFDLDLLDVQAGIYSWGPADNQKIIVTVVPESATSVLGVVGVFGLLMRRRRVVPS